jgi:magnesium-transporting ATPase (P-type)
MALIGGTRLSIKRWRFEPTSGLLLVGCATFAALAAGRALDSSAPQTMAYATLALSELALAFGMRSTSIAAWRLPVNRWLVASTLGAATFVAVSVYVQAAHEPFATVNLSAGQALIVVALASLPLVVVELLKALRRRAHPLLASPTTTSRPATTPVP